MLISQKNKYLQEKLENQKTLKEIMDRYSFALKENIELKKLVDLYENEKYSKIDTFSVCGGEIKKDPIYKGKKALIGDYLSSSYTNTEKVLRSLGFSVEIVPTVNDIVEKIGIDKSLQALEKAELVIVVIDGSEALTDEDHKLLEMTKNKNRIVVYNKNDKAIQHDGISISAINGDVEALTNAIKEKYEKNCILLPVIH